MRVLPHFWQTVPFRAAVLALLAGLAFGLYHWRVSDLKRRQALRQEFSRRLIESQEQERKRIAGELHDSLGQDLLVIKNRLLLNTENEELPAEAKDDLRDLSGIASHALKNVREIAQNLRPHLLDHLGLTRAIQDTVKKMARSGDIQFEGEIGDVDRCLPPEFEINFFRIVQEILNNIVKHSRATNVQFRLSRDPSCLRLTVQDNGIGFDPSQVPVAKSFGLSGLAERVRIMGGQCEVVSQPGSGTAIRIEVSLIQRSSSGPGEKA
jgi:signal transduction histidine kinase